MSAPMDRFQFGPFEIQPHSGFLFKAGVPVRLAPQPFQILSLLVERRGALVTREEIQAAVWNDGTTVEFDQGLNYCIRQIRIALGDDARQSQFIETLPKRGYRLVVPVVSVTPTETPAVPAPLVQPEILAPPAPKFRFAAAIVLFASLGLYGWKHVLDGPLDPSTSRLFQAAHAKAQSWDVEKTREAIADLREVIHRAPKFAPAHAELASVLVVSGMMNESSVEILSEAEAAARNALRLDADLPLAHAALGHCFWQKWMWAEGGAELQRAVVLGPNLSVTHQLYALYLASLRRSKDAIGEAQRAHELEPANPLMNYNLTRIYFYAGELDKSIEAAHRTREVIPDFPLLFPMLMRAHLLKGEIEKAADVIADWKHYRPVAPDWKIFWLARSGQMEEAKAAAKARKIEAATLKNGPAVSFAVALLAIGDIDGAFEVIQGTVERHGQSAMWLDTLPEIQHHRDDPRFQKTLFRMGIPQALPGVGN